MNEELQKQIADILKQAMAVAQHGGQWLSGQVPDVLNQLIAWTITVAAVSAVCLIVMVIITFKVEKKVRAFMLDDTDWAPAYAIFIVVMIILYITAGWYMLDTVLDGIKAFVAPKLFLLEYAAHLIK